MHVLTWNNKYPYWGFCSAVISKSEQYFRFGRASESRSQHSRQNGLLTLLCGLCVIVHWCTRVELMTTKSVLCLRNSNSTRGVDEKKTPKRCFSQTQLRSTGPHKPLCNTIGLDSAHKPVDSVNKGDDYGSLFSVTYSTCCMHCYSDAC